MYTKDIILFIVSHYLLCCHDFSCKQTADMRKMQSLRREHKFRLRGKFRIEHICCLYSHIFFLSFLIKSRNMKTEFSEIHSSLRNRGRLALNNTTVTFRKVFRRTMIIHSGTLKIAPQEEIIGLK